MITSQKFLNGDEVLALRETFRLRKGLSARDVLMLDLLLSTGPRASELLALRVCDFSVTNRTIFYRGTKGSRDRELPLPEYLCDALSFYTAAMADPSGLIFPLSYNGLRKVWFKHRPVRKKLHSLRHTFAMTLYRRSKDIRLVRQCLGHCSMITTLIYTEYDQQLDELRAAMW